jgi:hypothetical protein
MRKFVASLPQKSLETWKKILPSFQFEMKKARFSQLPRFNPGVVTLFPGHFSNTVATLYPQEALCT